MCRSVFLISLLLLWASRAFSDPVLATDNFVSPCPFINEPPPGGFQLWSNRDTWEGKDVPGIGKGAGSNVTIPCSMAVLLDLPDIEIHTLRVQGFLKLLDSENLPSIHVRAHYILVEGQFTIGSPSTQFKSTAKIELTPNLKGKRADFMFTSNSPADPSHPRNLGHKAFAVVGGQVHLHGLPTKPNSPVWTKLSKTANVGDTQLTLDRIVGWPVGSDIVVASTDYEPEQAEVFVITERSGTSKGTVLKLNKPFQFMHYGNPAGLPDGFGGYLDQCAEVALLSRNIIIMGSKESSPYELEGGHFMIFHTQIQQFIEGVDFQNMGQQGKLGRYPIHFHLNGDHARGSGTVCRKNTVRQSNQRCLIIHATFGMKIEENVAYDIKGHCFVTEEGGETNNYFVRNIGILIKSVSKLIPTEDFPGASPETDSKPSVFWMSHPNNHLINNVAAGSEDSGIWFEMRKSVRGISRKWSKISDILPKEGVLGTVKGNTVHSAKVGFRLYPHGLFSKVNGVRVMAYVSNLNSYKNSWMGVFTHKNDGVVFDNLTLADNQIGMWMRTVQGNVLNNSRVVGLSNNYGNPKNCHKSTPRTKCISTTSCKLPVPDNEVGRSIGWSDPMVPIYGVQMEQHVGVETGFLPNSITFTKFSNFARTCWPAAAIFLSGDTDLRFWNSAHYVKKLQFTKNTNRMWIISEYYRSPSSSETSFVGEMSKYFNLRDMDGSLIGSDGYAVANNKGILPINSKLCQFKGSWNAYACSGVCYRSILIEYPEPGFLNSENAGVGDFSSLIITRVEDNKSFRVHGNYISRGLVSGEKPDHRYFYFNVLGGYTYTVAVQPSSKRPGFYPDIMTIYYKDGVGCGKEVIFRIPAPNNRQWTVGNAAKSLLETCSVVIRKGLRLDYFNYVCVNGVSILEIYALPDSNSLKITTSQKSTSCQTSNECSLTNMGDSGWRYDTSGKEWHTQFIKSSFDDRSWLIGSAPFGNHAKLFKTIVPNPSNTLLTYYYRRSFFLSSASCYKGLKVSVMFQDGGVVYLNGKELLRVNMPSGTVTQNTLASSKVLGSLDSMWKSFNIPLQQSNSGAFLVKNTNVLAVALHAHHWKAKWTSFDIRISAIRSSTCKAM